MSLKSMPMFRGKKLIKQEQEFGLFRHTFLFNLSFSFTEKNERE